MADSVLDKRIVALRKRMARLYEEHGNLQHPEILEISRRIDRLVVRWMRQAQPVLPDFRRAVPPSSQCC